MENFINQITHKNLPKNILDVLQAHIENQNIDYIWFHQEKQQSCSLLTVMGKNKSLLEKDFSKNIIGETLKNDQVLISILDETDRKQHAEDGYLFFNRHAQAKDQIYGNAKNGIRYWFFEHDLKKIRNRYLAGESLLTKYAEELSRGDVPGATLLYVKNIQHDLEFLEYLRLGKSFLELTVSERLLQLEKFIPQLKQFFVKEGDSFYLINFIEKEDDVNYMEEYQLTVKNIQAKMKQLVMERLKQKQSKNLLLKQTVKNRLLEKKEVKKALRPLLDTRGVEELFLFHETACFAEDHSKMHYYIMALIEEENQLEIENALQKIRNNTPSGMQFTILYHTRLWIQEGLYAFQPYFKKILDLANKIFTTGYHPAVHWYQDRSTNAGDLFLHKRSTKKLYKTHLQRSDRNKKSVMISFIPHYLYHYFGQTIKNHLYGNFGYLPQTNDLQTLWDLFIYSNNSDVDYGSVISHFPFDVIGYLHENREQKLPTLSLNQEAKKRLFDLLKEIRNTY